MPRSVDNLRHFPNYNPASPKNDVVKVGLEENHNKCFDSGLNMFGDPLDLTYDQRDPGESSLVRMGYRSSLPPGAFSSWNDDTAGALVESIAQIWQFESDASFDLIHEDPLY